jgi:hypothetical protein
VQSQRAEVFAVIAADICCYAAVFRSGFSEEKYVVSAAWLMEPSGIAENSEGHGIPARRAGSCRGDFADGFHLFDRLMNTA